MPAIRKSSRQSRTSTPYATPTNNQLPSDEGRGDKTQSFLDSWVEPPPRNPAPSFEDHGFARQGVLETMAPLGARPSHRMKMKARTYPDPPTRRSTSGRNGELLAPDQTVVSTPEMTPAREIERDSERMDDDEVSAGPPTQDPDEDEDDDWVPKKSKGNKPVVKTPVRGKTPVQNKTPSQARTPLKSGTAPSSSMLSTSARKSMPSLLGTDSGTAAGEQKIQIAVNDAVTRAKAHNRPDLIDALRQMHENARSDNGIRVMLEAVIYSNASGEQHKQFSRFIKDVKKRYKRNSRASTVRGARDTTHSDAASNLHSAPLSPSSSPLPAKATNGGSTRSAERFLTNNAASSLPTQLFDPMDISSDNTPVAGQEQAVDAGSAQAHPLSTIPSLAKRSPSPGTRMPSKSPRKHEPSNEGTVVETDAAKEVSTMHATSPDSILGDSDSALSEVDEAVVQNGPPVSPKKTNGTAAAAAPGPKKTLPAQARIGKKSRANSAKPNGRFEKKAPPTAEEKAEEAEIMRRREQMAQQQPVRANYNPPVSDMRFGFEDEMLETESLTDSQIAVGPPMDSSRPRRTGRPSRVSLNLNVGKRMREDSQALSSPQPLISATSTRPTTPAFAPPPAKRLKLTNGGAARTKRSPVKNRDGPIAGIAHPGGGSRQLGPDDNDPGSPPSESDDFCSACKGAGEFVCCDTCPRVYHFLCCDPPRFEPPSGSFFCHECTEKAAAAEGPVVDRFAVFGPLMKRLDATNPRSFALPLDIQDYFEGVTARNDGSYSEDLKKISLSKSSGYGYQKPDYLRTHDADGKQILCVQCGLSAAGKRQMLKCDFCDAYWHLDCCDPPLANPPPINLESASRDAWKCPRHVDHDLRSGSLFPNDLRYLARGDDVDMLDAPPRHLVTRKIRKPKRPSVVEPLFSRGMRNNGLIEVINDEADETDGEGNYMFPSDDPNSKLYRIPEKGIILDFIHKVQSSRVEKHRDERKANKAARARSAFQKQFAARPIQQQQTALHLAQLANKEQDIGLNEQSVSGLYLSLTAEAPEDVVAALSDEQASAAAETRRAELLKLRELIDRALEA